MDGRNCPFPADSLLSFPMKSACGIHPVFPEAPSSENSGGSPQASCRWSLIFSHAGAQNGSVTDGERTGRKGSLSSSSFQERRKSGFSGSLFLPAGLVQHPVQASRLQGLEQHGSQDRSENHGQHCVDNTGGKLCHNQSPALTC